MKWEIRSWASIAFTGRRKSWKRGLEPSEKKSLFNHRAYRRYCIRRRIKCVQDIYISDLSYCLNSFGSVQLPNFFCKVIIFTRSKKFCLIPFDYFFNDSNDGF